MTTVSFCPLNALLPSPVIPLSSYPAIRYTIRGRHPSSFISRTPISDHMLLPSVSSHSYRSADWPRISNIPISALPCACALALTLYLYLSSPSPPLPPPSSLPSGLASHSHSHRATHSHRSTAPPAHYSRSRPRYARFFFPSVSYLNIFSLSILPHLHLLFDADLSVLSWICQYQRSIRCVFPPPSLFLALISSLC